MKSSENRQPEENEEKTEEDEKKEGERSLKNAMYTSIIFVGGGIAFFWLLLFITYQVRL